MESEICAENPIDALVESEESKTSGEKKTHVKRSYSLLLFLGLEVCSTANTLCIPYDSYDGISFLLSNQRQKLVRGLLMPIIYGTFNYSYSMLL